MARYAEKLHIVPLLNSAGSTTAAVLSYAAALENTQWLSFLVTFGAMTSDSTDVVNVKVVATDTLGNTTDAQDIGLPFYYRLSGAPGANADVWGDITAATAAAGLDITAVQDNMNLLIDVDPASVPSLHSTAKGVRVVLDGTGSVAAVASTVTGLIESRYPQNAHIPAST